MADKFLIIRAGVAPDAIPALYESFCRKSRYGEAHAAEMQIVRRVLRRCRS